MLKNLHGSIQYLKRISFIAEEEERTLAPNFWDDAKKAEEILRKIKLKKNIIVQTVSIEI